MWQLCLMCGCCSFQLQDSPLVQQLYTERLDGQPFSHAAQQLLHTQYHRRDKPTSMAMVGDW
jgi:Iron hydrogenase small subunit